MASLTGVTLDVRILRPLDALRQIVWASGHKILPLLVFLKHVSLSPSLLSIAKDYTRLSLYCSIPVYFKSVLLCQNMQQRILSFCNRGDITSRRPEAAHWLSLGL